MRISDWSSDVCSSDLPHQIARPVGGQLRRCEIEDAEHRLLPLADREAADRIAVEADGGQRRGRTRAQPFVERTLLDAEQRRARRMRPVRIEALANGRASCRDRVCQYV